MKLFSHLFHFFCIKMCSSCTLSDNFNFLIHNLDSSLFLVKFNGILQCLDICFHVSGIDVAYKEAVALKRQEELIREEELLENEKGKRGSAIEKDKRAKKKQVQWTLCFCFDSSCQV